MTSKPTVICDIELYRNYLLIGFRNVATGNVRHIEVFGEGDKLSADDTKTLRGVFERYRTVTFNGNNYDIPMISAALKGATCAELKVLSDKIIVNNIKHWNLGIELVRCDHIDIFDVAPLMASLKIYGGRLHCPKMQDLPIAPDAVIRDEDRPLLRLYNGNDMETTQRLYEHLALQIALREKMSAVYNVDLRSKSDAQIAETVIVRQLENILGKKIDRPEVPSGTRFNYTPPKFLAFSRPELRELLATTARLEFLVTDGGSVQMPDGLKKAAARIEGGVYRLGIGGLHSSEQVVSYYSDETWEVSDHDVTSYYPEIILTNGIAPPHMGHHFLRVFGDQKNQRVAAKRNGDKVAADSLKIVVNGAGGKLNSKWSKLYYPQGFIHMTLTGQLSLLMLIERLVDAGVEVLSANTDGVTVRTRRDRLTIRDEVIAGWEHDTAFATEATFYRSIHIRDVNNYIAIKDDGKFKLKGAFAMEDLCPSAMVGLAKNPANEVCIEAAALFLRDGVPVETTVRNCTDIRRFVTIRQVNGGAIDQAGNYLGKAVRWYYAKGVAGPLRYKVNNYTVARSEGARPCMDLPDTLPSDVDHDWYIREAQSLLADVGVEPSAYQIRDLV